MSELSGITIVMMIAICGIVWGGFAVLLWRAVRREGEKQHRE